MDRYTVSEPAVIFALHSLHKVALIFATAILLLGCGGGGSGGGSVTTAVTAPTPAPTPAAVLAAPAGIIAAPGDGLISLSFPALAGALDYTATCVGNGAAVTAANTASPIAVLNLTNGTAYSCTVTARNSAGSSPASAPVTATPSGTGGSGAFRGTFILGSPTNAAVKLNIYAADQSGQVYAAYGNTPGAYPRQTTVSTLSAGTPLELSLDGLSANTRYYYRLYFTPTAGGAASPSAEFSFQTPRAAGASFVFDIQGDSHPEREKTEFNGELYTRTLTMAAADNPDFYMTSGDDFSVDTLDPVTISAVAVANRYAIQRPYLGIVGRKAPVFLVNGNHEQAARYLLNGTPNNVAVWAQNARNSFYSEPAPNEFYTGNTETVPFIGQLRNYYAWTWGDALFVVIDPYWSSPVPVDNVFGGTAKTSRDWDVTHGDVQYQWLKDTLEKSKAKYKFVFAHHVLGTGRGGVEVAKLWEWGGLNANGTSGFAVQRPTWAMPIHQLMVANRVTIFFQGHDHIWVHQMLDGVTYQTLPEPANPFYALLNSEAYVTGDKFPTSGYTRISVSPANVKVEYVRSYLPADEAAGKKSGEVAFSYVVNAP
jgi:hypothetical protein